MKTLVIGDIHGKTIWREIVNKEQADKIIFLGDYVTTHKLETPEQQVANLESIFEYAENKRAEGIEVILLRGNHCVQMLGYDWAGCSGWDQKLYELIFPLRQKYLDMTQWIYSDGNIVFSHAGVSTEWMERIAGIKSIDEINDLPPSELFGFNPCKMSDYYGISPTQPPTWIRPQTLIEYMPEGWIQVVGHTPVKKLCNVSNEVRENYNIDCPDLWCCDALDNEEYLVIEDGLFIPKKLNDYDKDSKSN
jgi:hypothetical protein